MSNSSVETLAALYGLTTSYTDAANKPQTCSEEAIIAVLRILGVDVLTSDDVERQLETRRAELWRPGLADVTTLWADERNVCFLQGPASRFKGVITAHAGFENGETKSFPIRIDDCRVVATIGTGKSKQVRLEVPLFSEFPIGYHTLHMEVGSSMYTSFVISAPAKGISPQTRWPNGPPVGAFLPLYSLFSSRGIGLGTLADLEKIVRWAGELDLGFFATLPLLSTFLTEPFEPSPYAPASRLFWNELYADVRNEELFQPLSGVSASDIDAATADAYCTPFVDYPKQHKLQFSALKSASKTFFVGNEPNSDAFQAFLASYPDVYDYATFRARTDITGRPWPSWSTDADFDVSDAKSPSTELENAYVLGQYLCHRQLTRIGNIKKTGLYLDLPVGVHPDSYDIWKHRDLFAVGAAAGAPPDPLFSKGQNWGFPPMHPTNLKKDNYGYFRAMVQRPMKYAAMVRLDHVMSLHRMYWVPEGFKATDGVYVQYPAQHLAAILCIESARTGCVVAGEDLGTVPELVRDIMSARGILRLYVGQFSVSPDPNIGLVPPSPQTIACLNTHDMPTFASFWRETDLDDQVDLGLLDETEERHERLRRKTIRKSLLLHLQKRGVLPDEPVLEDVLSGLLTRLSESPAACAVINLEDLWLELLPQNTPGTWKERPNWRRRARYSLENILGNSRITQLLKQLASNRPKNWNPNTP
ncbi:MAG: 4-alpha-glucanotransferase [Myxococcales bacterium]|nr:4-alpha-glucanotransferase [Myxococcales bacterium]